MLFFTPYVIPLRVRLVFFSLNYPIACLYIPSLSSSFYVLIFCACPALFFHTLSFKFCVHVFSLPFFFIYLCIPFASRGLFFSCFNFCLPVIVYFFLLSLSIFVSMQIPSAVFGLTSLSPELSFLFLHTFPYRQFRYPLLTICKNNFAFMFCFSAFLFMRCYLCI